MKRLRAKVLFSLSIIVTGILGTLHINAHAESRNLPLVFDPKTKKYFIGGSSKFMLKQQEKSALVDRIEIAIDSGDYQPYGSAIQFTEEGKHTLKFRAVNSVNNWSPVQFVEVFVDLTAPTTEAKFSGDKFFKDETGALFAALNSSISLVSQDNLSGIASIEFSWDNVAFKPYQKPILVEKPGKQTLFFHSTDRVGNIEPVQRLDFMADGTSPNSVLRVRGKTRSIPIMGKNYTVVSDSVAFAIEATDDASKVKQIWVSIDEAAATPYIKPIYFLQEGPHTVKYFAEDYVGNKEEPKNLSVYSVSVPPRTTATATGKIVNTGGINFSTRSFQLKLEAKDNVAGLDRVEIKLDAEADFKTYLEPILFKTPGLHTVTYRAVDRAGNIEPAKTYTVDIYETAPETSMATAQPLIVREGISYSPAPNILTFNVSNSSVGVQQTFYAVNDMPFKPYIGPITLTTDQKIYKVAYKSLDRLGNEERAKVSTIHMVGAIPIVDLFISNGQSAEEQVRTNYFEQAGVRTNPTRDVATPEEVRKTAKEARESAPAIEAPKKEATRDVTSPAEPMEEKPAAMPQADPIRQSPPALPPSRPVAPSREVNTPPALPPAAPEDPTRQMNSSPSQPSTGSRPPQ